MRAGGRRAVAAVIVVVGVIAGLSAAYASEQPALAELDGKLMVAHGDDFSGGMRVMQSWVQTAHGNVPVSLPAAKHTQALKLSGHKVKLRGTSTGASFAAASLAPAESLAAPQHTTLRIAFVLMDVDSSMIATAQNHLFGASPFSVGNYFNEVSSNQVTTTAKIFGPYTSGFTSPQCSLWSWMDAASTAAAKNGYKASDYDSLVIFGPGQNGCGYAGIASVGSSGVFLNGVMQPSVTEHEIGHNLGLLHAGTASCTKFTASCKVVEYGDAIDPMGMGGRQFSAYHKNVIGWLPNSAVATVSSGTQTVTLTSQERAPAPGKTQLINIPRSSASGGGMLTIERRESYGNIDVNQHGVYIRWATNSKPGDDTVMIDPGPPRGYINAYLNPGSSWTDTKAGITITTIADDPASPSAIVKVCFGTCSTDPGGSTTTTSSSTTSSTTTTSTSVPGSTTTTTIKGNGPKVTITSPTAGMHVTGNIRVLANAPGAVRMELWVDGRLLGKHEGPNFSRQWTAGSASVKAGPHTVTVKAYDSSGQVGTASVSVTK